MGQHKIDNLELRAGKLCLDFANTVGWHASSHPVEWLESYEDLIRWSRRAEILTDEQVTGFLALERQRSEEAQRVYRHALQWRESLYRLFLAFLKGNVVEESDLAWLNQQYALALAQQRVIPGQSGFTLIWLEEAQRLDAPLWQVARSAVEVVTSEDLKRVHLCAGLECGWLFFDQSKNQSRKWCASQDCGNRDRVRRHYRQKHLSNQR